MNRWWGQSGSSSDRPRGIGWGREADQLYDSRTAEDDAVGMCGFLCYSSVKEVVDLEKTEAVPIKRPLAPTVRGTDLTAQRVM